MNDIRGVIRAVREWNIGRIKFNLDVQREIIVVWIVMIDFTRNTESMKKKKKLIQIFFSSREKVVIVRFISNFSIVNTHKI